MQTYVWVHLGNYHKAAFRFDGLDLQFLQTLAGCIATLALCYHIHYHWLKNHLRWLAELSFPIFFIHPLFTMALENIAAIDLINHWFPVTDVTTSLVVFSVVFLIQFYGSAGIAQLIRAALKKHSKYLMG
jgi:surface polysaccharide O-acyltransferase-like enzyme